MAIASVRHLALDPPLRRHLLEAGFLSVLALALGPRVHSDVRVSVRLRACCDVSLLFVCGVVAVWGCGMWPRSRCGAAVCGRDRGVGLRYVGEICP